MLQNENRAAVTEHFENGYTLHTDGITDVRNLERLDACLLFPGMTGFICDNDIAVCEGVSNEVVVGIPKKLGNRSREIRLPVYAHGAYRCTYGCHGSDRVRIRRDKKCGTLVSRPCGQVIVSRREFLPYALYT